MSFVSSEKLKRLQTRKLDTYQAKQCIDIHCHCLPALDDGPEDLSAAVQLCVALVAEGFTTVVATPHQFGYFDGDYSALEIRSSVTALNVALQKRGIPLTVLPGAEIRVDERIIPYLLHDRLVNLADKGRFVLLELPFDTYLDIGPMLQKLKTHGYRAVIAHPERNSALAEFPERVLSWIEHEPILQVTAGSLVGRFGGAIQHAAYKFIDMPVTACVATDAHDVDSRGLFFSDAFKIICTYLGHEKARQLFIETPSAILNESSITSHYQSDERSQS